FVRTGPRVKATPNTQSSIAAIKASLTVTRRTGVAFSGEEAIAGVVGFAAPVFSAMGVPVASFGVGVPSSQFKRSATSAIESALKDASRRLSQQLGWNAARAA